MSNFIKSKLSQKNEFRCLGSFELFGMKPNNLSFKIDTGCGRTSVPLKKVNIESSVLEQYKNLDYSDESIIKTVSFGVNDTAEDRDRAKVLIKQKRYSEIHSLMCTRTLKNFTIGGVNLGDISLRVSYTRVGNILIGMDILSKMECHIITTPDNETYFLACPIDQIKAGNGDDFYIELENLYNLGSNINSAVLKSVITGREE